MKAHVDEKQQAFLILNYNKYVAIKSIFTRLGFQIILYKPCACFLDHFEPSMHQIPDVTT